MGLVAIHHLVLFPFRNEKLGIQNARLAVHDRGECSVSNGPRPTIV